jgi:uncharacterized protein (DUF779 family)
MELATKSGVALRQMLREQPRRLRFDQVGGRANASSSVCRAAASACCHAMA